MAPSLSALNHDVLATLSSALSPSTLAAFTQTCTTLHAAGTPSLLRTLSILTAAHAAALSALLARLPHLAPSIRALRIGPRDPNTHRDAAASITSLLEATSNLRTLDLDQASPLLARPRALAALAACRDLSILRLADESVSGPPEPSVHAAALLNTLRAPLRRLCLVHIKYPGLLASLAPFADTLEELEITGAAGLTDAVPETACWPHVHALALRNCTFSTPALARLFPNVRTLAVSAGGLPYAGSFAAPAEDAGAESDFDADAAAWPALATLECDVHGLRQLAPLRGAAHAPHLDLRAVVLGAQTDGALLFPELDALRPAALALTVGREVKPAFWAGLARAAPDLRALAVDVIWDATWAPGDALDALVRAFLLALVCAWL